MSSIPNKFSPAEEWSVRKVKSKKKWKSEIFTLRKIRIQPGAYIGTGVAVWNWCGTSFLFSNRVEYLAERILLKTRLSSTDSRYSAPFSISRWGETLSFAVGARFRDCKRSPKRIYISTSTNTARYIVIPGGIPGSHSSLTDTVAIRRYWEAPPHRRKKKLPGVSTLLMAADDAVRLIFSSIRPNRKFWLQSRHCFSQTK